LCRSTGTSTLHRVPKRSASSRVAGSLRAPAINARRSQAASPEPTSSTRRNTRALWRPRGCVGLRQ
jgi:hypothetical protein